ncbi:MAG: VaFE repeat-containing surface-anchored protein [Eisenbergiella sp.]
MVQETGEEYLSDGEPVTAEKVFTPEEASGSVTLPYALDSSDLAGQTLVVYEKLYCGGSDCIKPHRSYR